MLVGPRVLRLARALLPSGRRGAQPLLCRGISSTRVAPRPCSARSQSGTPGIFPTASALRAACRAGEFTGPTAGQAPGCVQANLVILQQEHAADFRQFCANNAAPCPLLEMTAPGQHEAVDLAPGSDLRTDLPRYRIWRHGEMVEERCDVTDLWLDDMQGFLLGCSFSWEDLLAAAGLTPRHMQEGCNVPMFDTNIRLRGSGPFQGNMVVSMRPYRPEALGEVVKITGAYPAAHGPPVQVGQPEAIGVGRELKPDYGEPVTVRGDEVPVFWACGVTPQNALRQAKLDLVITHAPGHMFVGDVSNEDIKAWSVPGRWSARPDEEP